MDKYDERYDGDDRKRETKIVDERGNQITLSTHQKNKLYDDAKRLKEHIQDKLCSRDECRIPTDKSINKMIKSEFMVKKQIEGFKKRMQAIGADPRDYDINRFRR